MSKSPPQPVFIIGAPRSGTSVTTWALGQHPNIQPMPETAWIASFIIGACVSHIKGSERGALSHLSNVDYDLSTFLAHTGENIHKIVCEAFETRCQNTYGKDYRTKGLPKSVNPANQNRNMQLLRSLEDTKSRWVDGTPLNSQFVWGLSEAFPEAKFIHLLRPPEDVISSLLKFDNAGGKSQKIDEAVHNWSVHTENAWLAEQAFGPKKVITIQYNELIQEKEAIFTSLLGFLNEEYHTDCLLPYETKINSSKIDTERENLISKIRSNKSYERAFDLYKKITQNTNVIAKNDEALAIITQRFLDHCYGKSLL